MNILQEIKLSIAKTLAQLSEENTQEGILYSEQEINLNSPVYVFNDKNELVKAPDGVYTNDKRYIVQNGVITSIEMDEAPAEAPVETPVEIPAEPIETPTEVETPAPVEPEVEEPKGPSETDILRETISKLEESLNKQSETIEKLITSYNNLTDEKKPVEIKDSKIEKDVHPALAYANQHKK